MSGMGRFGDQQVYQVGTIRLATILIVLVNGTLSVLTFTVETIQRHASRVQILSL